MRPMKLIRCFLIICLSALFLLSSIPLGVSLDSANTQNHSNAVTETVVLITGFEPFGEYEINPSQIIAETLDGQEVAGVHIVGIIVPVDFEESVAVVTQAIQDVHPVIVISLGLEASTHTIHVEHLGVNVRRDPNDKVNGSRIRKIESHGPCIRLASLPCRAITRELLHAGIPVRQSWFAGTYVCNALFYGVLGYISDRNLDIRAGFLHVPLLSSQDPEGMTLETMLEAVKLTIDVSLKER